MSKRSNKWDQIWNDRGKHYPEDDSIKLGGWDQPFGMMTEETVRIVVFDIIEKLQLHYEDVLLELGCGAGMLLSRLSSFSKDCYGTDLSGEMIARAKKLFPRLNLIQADSIRLPFVNDTFDKILCHSVFQYFPDNVYAEQVMNELLRVSKPNAIIFISDIMDEDKKSNYLKFREEFPVQSQILWRSSEEKVEHFYYNKQFFYEFAAKKNLGCMITDRNIEGYPNSKYRFDVLLSK